MNDSAESIADADLDPRAQRTRLKLIHAMQEIVGEQGLGALTHQTLAERAGVGRATVYRHFPTRRDIFWSILEVLDLQRARLDTAGQSLEESAVSLLMWAGHRFEEPLNRAFILAVLARTPYDADAREMFDYRMAEIREIVQSMITQYSPATWPSEREQIDLAARVIGPVFFRTMIMGMPVDETFVREHVATIVREAGLDTDSGTPALQSE